MKKKFGLLIYNYRGPRLYFDFFNGRQNLRQRDIEVSINTVLTRPSFIELDQLKELAASFGAKLRVSRFRPSGRGKQSWTQLNVDREQLVAFSKWLAENLAVSTGDSFFSVATEERRSLGLNMCGACKLTCCLSPMGEVYPCAFLQEAEFLAGKLPHDSFDNVWQNSTVFHSFRQLEIKSCENCYRFDLCHCGCPEIAYHTQRKLGLPDSGCLANCVTEKPLAAVSI